MKFITFGIMVLAVLAGCSAPPKTEGGGEQKPAKPTETITGRAAFQKLYTTARAWASDAKPFRLESESTKDAAGADGKSAVWRGSFASPSRRAIKPFMWSGTGSGERGISPGSEDTYNPKNTSTQPFDIAFLKTDSDTAFQLAQKHGGEKVLKAAANTPVFYVLDWNPGQSELVWHVIYGSNRQDAKLRVAVDATKGAFMKVEK